MSDYLLVNHKTNRPLFSDEDMVAFVPMANVQEGSNVVSFDIVPYKQVKNGFTVFEKGDLLWAKITPCMQNGKSFTSERMPTKVGFASTEFHVIHPKSNNLYMPYIWAFFSDENVLKAAQATFGGSAGQQRVPTSFIENFPAVIPKYEEQKHLASNIERALAEKNKKLEQAEKLLNGISAYIHELLHIHELPINKPSYYATKRICLKSRIDVEYNNPFYLHRIDEIKKVGFDVLGNVIEFSTEYWNQKDYFDLYFPYIEISNVKTKQNAYQTSKMAVSSAPSRAKMIVRNGDILVSTTRPHRGAIATVQCAPHEMQIASTGFCVLRNLKRSDILKNYLQWILLDDYILAQMLQRSSGGNYPAITSDELKKVVIPIPSVSLQMQICKEASSRQKQAEKLRAEAEQGWKEARAQFERELMAE